MSSDARFQAGSLSSEDFHRVLRISQIFIDFMDFDGLLGLLGFGVWVPNSLKMTEEAIDGLLSCWACWFARLAGRFGFLVLLD